MNPFISSRFKSVFSVDSSLSDPDDILTVENVILFQYPIQNRHIYNAIFLSDPVDSFLSDPDDILKQLKMGSSSNTEYRIVIYTSDLTRSFFPILTTF